MYGLRMMKNVHSRLYCPVLTSQSVLVMYILHYNNAHNDSCDQQVIDFIISIVPLLSTFPANLFSSLSFNPLSKPRLTPTLLSLPLTLKNRSFFVVL